ncbi:hypothetical protein [Kiritimatiella glycovorans]|uniref:Uncharacterized protein n=1 Tax=Kiritimatiella glycovorans TaxID=1307763 RepID=A0A0G3EJ61_9BACT|nr:hypothetical protein [Kiritimatiella glycovorans]AKJ64224.1 hypothetical protein L21SP4_00964 [Kiritimatiella glycovorans]
MALTNPQTFFRFAAEHYALLCELYYKKDGLPEAEVFALIRRYAEPQSPTAPYMRDRLLDLGILEPSPQATAQLEMTRPVATLMGYLLREYRLTSVEVIRSYFNAIDNLASELGDAVSAANSDLLVRVNGELEEHVERMRHDSRNNRAKVIADVIRIKTNRERLAPRQRYEVINRLWTRYIAPLRDIIDTQKSMDAALDRLTRVYGDAETRFAADGVVQQVVRGGEARLRRLRRDVLDDFNETVREVTPLYEELRQETAIARGASHALERIVHRGLSSLDLPNKMGICNWRQRGIFSDLALEAYLFELRGYEPHAPEPLPAPLSPGQKQDYDDLARFPEDARSAVPIDDAFAWLAETYPHAAPLTLLKLYGRLHGGRYGHTNFGSPSRRYQLGNLCLSAHPMSVATGDIER